MIIRMYSVDTKFAVMSHQAEEVKPQAPVESEDLMAELASFRVAHEIYQSNKEARVRSADLSLSTWALIVAGIAEGPAHPKADAKAHEVFAKYFHEMKEFLTNYTKAIRKRGHVIMGLETEGISHQT